MTRVHLVNVGESNGGDVLMAMAAAANLERRLGPLTLTVNGRSLRDAAALRIRGAPQSGLDRFSQRLVRAFGPRVILPEQRFRAGDLVLDANGYRHGGIWPEENLERDLVLAGLARAAGARVALLPKSYGPFDARSGALFGRLAAAVDLAYARDAESFGHCRPWSAAVRLRPDFTISVAAAPGGSAPEVPARPVLVVPNAKLVERGIVAHFDAYADFVAACVRHLAFLGRPVRVLFHQAKDVRELDARLGARGIARSFHADPRQAKAELRDAHLVVSSRYHGMIGALTQGTPCLVLGWSHKYGGFLDRYSLGRQLLIGAASVEALAERLAWIGQGDHRAAVRASLEEGNAALAREAQALWDEVAGLY